MLMQSNFNKVSHSKSMNCWMVSGDIANLSNSSSVRNGAKVVPVLADSRDMLLGDNADDEVPLRGVSSWRSMSCMQTQATTGSIAGGQRCEMR